MAAENSSERDAVSVIVRSTGLNLSTDEMNRVIMLYARYASDRATLAGAVAGEIEPATIFHALHREDHDE